RRIWIRTRRRTGRARPRLDRRHLTRVSDCVCLPRVERIKGERKAARPPETAELTVDPAGELGRLYRSYRDELRNYVLRNFGGGPPEPEDVVQAVFATYAAATGAREV